MQEIKSTYNLIQHKHGKNVSCNPFARNQIHALADPAQARKKCQSPMGCKKSKPRTNLTSTSMARISVSNGLQEIKSTYKLNKHKHGKNVRLQWIARNQIHVQT